MDIKKAIACVSKHKNLKNVCKKAFLAHAFVMVEGPIEEWQIGYFCEKDDRMISFIVADEPQELPPAEVLKSHDLLKELDADNVTIAPEQALEAARNVNTAHYKGLPVIKTFYIIQDLGEGPIYNVTFITQAFTTMNVRISATDGKVLSHTNEPLIAFDKPLPKMVRKKK